MAEQSGFGFAPVFGASKQGPRVVRLAACGLFFMADAGSGWFPAAPASSGLEVARAAILGTYPLALVRLVEASEVGK